MPLTQEQFQKARQAGFSVEQIAGFEQRKQAESPKVSVVKPVSTPPQKNNPFSILSPILNTAVQATQPILNPQRVAQGLTQPATQTIGGKSLEQQTNESINSNKELGQSKVKPFDKNLGMVRPAVMGANVASQIADQFTVPSNYIGGRMFKPIVKIGGMIAKNIGKGANFEAGRLINSLIKPAHKEFNFGKNPGQQIVKEGITASSVDELKQKVTGKLNEAQQDLQNTLSQPQLASKIDDYSDAIKPIDEAITKAKRLPTVNSALIQRLQGVKKDLMNTGNLKKMNPVQAVQLKRDIGDATKWTKDGGEDDVKANVALKQAYHAVKTKIEKNVPGIKEKNDRLANLIDAETAVKRNWKVSQKEGLASGIFQKGALFDAAVGVSRGDVHEVLRGIGEYGITKLMSSPLAKTNVAQWLNNLSKSDVVKVVSQYPQLRSLLYKGIRQNPPQPTLQQQPFKNIKVNP